MATSITAPLNEECMRVVVRLKPPSDAEHETEFSSCVAADTQNNRISVTRNRKGNSEYSFYGWELVNTDILFLCANHTGISF